MTDAVEQVRTDIKDAEADATQLELVRVMGYGFLNLAFLAESREAVEHLIEQLTVDELRAVVVAAVRRHQQMELGWDSEAFAAWEGE